MVFLNPLLLIALPAAVLPLVLHLWMSRRMRTVQLATFRFLFDSYVQQRRRLRFLEALVAALRTLFLLALIMVVARPIVKHWSGLLGGDLGREIILMVDCSASMKAHTDGVSSLDRAKTAARAIAGRMSRGDRLTLVRVADEPEERFSRFSMDSAKIEQGIDSLEAGSSRANLLSALSLVTSDKDDRGHDALIYFLTDCQASEWQEVDEKNLPEALPEGSRFVVLDTGSGEALPNRAVLGHAPREARAILGLPVILRPRVANFGATKVDDLPLSIFVDDKEIARMRLTLNPGQAIEREIVYVPERDGVLKGRFELPVDRFPEDDSFLFTLTVVPKLGVLLVRPDSEDPADPQKDEALYLRTALTARIRDLPGQEGDAPDNPLVEALSLVETAEPGLSPERLSDAGVVILANCGGLSPEQCGWLRNFVFEGGGLLVFPGERVNGAVYNDHLFAVPNRADAGLTPARFGEARGDPERADTFQRLAAIDYDHPVMSVFQDPDAKFMRTVQFFRRFLIERPGSGPYAHVLARFGDEGPALVESRYGEGTLVVAAFPANTRWTNLPMKPEFVPLVLRLVGHLVRAPELAGPSVVSPGSAAEVTVDSSWTPAKGMVIDDMGRETAIDFQYSGTRLLGAFGGTRRKGYYNVEVKGAEAGDAQRTGTLSFAVNLAREESDFQTVGENQLRDLTEYQALTVIDATAQMQTLEGSIGEEREIWRPLIYLMFLVIGIEFLLATTSTGRRSADADQPLAGHAHRMSPTAWIRRMTGASEFSE
jgi:von Willebrand factor type A domain/Aerotolerance regulator N-terminal